MWKVVNELMPGMMMVVVQTSFAGMNVSYKLAANDGMSLTVLVAYRFLFAAGFIVPLALIYERKSRPKLTWVILFQAFICGLLGGALSQNLYIKSLTLTSATFASAMVNLTPVITFILAISFRLERLGLKSVAGKAKVVGTLMGVGGAMLLTFYKGVEIHIWSTHVDLLHQHSSHVASPQTSFSNRVWGALLVLGSSMAYALWLIVQAKMSKRYPCHYSSTALMNVMGSIQSVVFALCTEKDWKQWKLGWNIRLLAVAYTGIVVSGLMVTLISWCIKVKGPLYVSIFSPLVVVIVALVGSLFLDEKLHLGSILGAMLIVGGLYTVLWGKGKEMKRLTDDQPASSNSSKEAESIEIVFNSPPNNTSNLTVNNSASKEEEYEKR